jgi:hypothetical protein
MAVRGATGNWWTSSSVSAGLCKGELEKMHQQGLVHIAGWAKAGASYRWRPMYKLGAGENMPHPPTMTSTQRVHQFRDQLTADDKDFGDAKRRQQRRVVKRDPLVAAFFGKG